MKPSQNKNIKSNIQNTPKYERVLISNKHIVRKICEIVLLAVIIGAGSANASASEITVENVKSQINYQRELRGMLPLSEDDRLDDAAKNKSQDMIERDYFEHYAFGLTPWLFISNSNYNYLYAGENLAMDFQTSEGMVRAWMSSPTHRKNILNPDFEDLGVGIVKGEYTDKTGTHETIMVTNMFGKEKPKIIQFFENIFESIKNIF